MIVVGRAGRNRRDVAERVNEILTGAHAGLLGVVANGVKIGRRSPYGYVYPDPKRAARASANGASPAEEPRPTGPLDVLHGEAVDLPVEGVD